MIVTYLKNTTLKLNTTNNLLIAVALLWSVIGFAQATLNVSYGSPAIIISNNGSVNFGLSAEIEFSVTNIPSGGNPSLNVQSITSSNSNFIVSSNPYISESNIKKGEVGKFKIKKTSYSCGSGSSIITITSNVGFFSFTVNYNNAPSISVLGGTPTQPIPNGQTIPTSTNGTLFGTVTVGATATRNYLIVNTGTCSLTLGSLTCFGYDPVTGIQSPDFLIAIQPTPYPSAAGTPSSNVIAPGGASYFVVLFHPTSPGIKSAIISIPSNDATKNPYTFVVRGEGFNPSVTGPGGGIRTLDCGSSLQEGLLYLQVLVLITVSHFGEIWDQQVKMQLKLQLQINLLMLMQQLETSIIIRW